jgi:G:T/U-mismatch repair DNA glycosylase
MSNIDFSKFLYRDNGAFALPPPSHSELHPPQILSSSTIISSHDPTESNRNKRSRILESIDGMTENKSYEQKISSSEDNLMPSMTNVVSDRSPSKKARPSALLQYGFLREKYASPGHQELPLRAVMIGHNPSEKSWLEGHYYANPSNRMWYILRECGIVPASFTCVNDDDCPHQLGIGFTDLGTGYPETKSSNISDEMITDWAISLYQRLEAHIKRVAENLGSDASASAAAPKILVFCGVRQWKALFPANHFNAKKRPRIDDSQPAATKNSFGHGKQEDRPVNWPKVLSSCEVYVLPSTSGAAAMSNEDRINPYRLFANRLREFPWSLSNR